MTTSACRQALLSSVVSRCEPSCLSVLAIGSWLRFAQSRAIRLIRHSHILPCSTVHFDDTRWIDDQKSLQKLCLQPFRSPCATNTAPAVGSNFHHPSSPVILSSSTVASPQSAQTLVPPRARSCGPPRLRRAAKDSSPPLRSSSLHHPSSVSLPSVSLIPSVGSVYPFRPSNIRHLNRSSTLLLAHCGFASVTMTASQQRPTAVAGRGQKRVERVTDQLEKPSLDDRTYRVIRLSNQLEALLVHDPETDKASAAMDVNVGAFSDEEDMPGMAHAVEHVRDQAAKVLLLFDRDTAPANTVPLSSFFSWAPRSIL